MFDPERSPFQAALGGSRRIFLHAWRVELPTKSGARQAVTCPLPDDLAGVRRGEKKGDVRLDAARCALSLLIGSL